MRLLFVIRHLRVFIKTAESMTLTPSSRIVTYYQEGEIQLEGSNSLSEIIILRS